VGDSFSVADISMASPFVNWGYAGEHVDAGRWPRLTAFLERVHSRPSFAPLLEEEKVSLASLRG
jgi:glutathione S-transferase